MDNRTIGQHIGVLRKLKNMKAYEMANRLGMKESTYTKYERGETAITIEFVTKVAFVLNMEPLQIIIASPKSIFEGVSKASKNESIEKKELSTIIEGIMDINQKLAAILEK